MKKIIVGNWKLNLDHLQGIQLLQKINYSLDKDIEEQIDIVLAPSHTSLRSLQTVISTDNLKIKISSQDVSSQNDGAFTGEVSAFQLKKLNIDYSIIGHSERRLHFNETDSDVNSKLSRLLENDITPILCFGESLEQRSDGSYLEFVKNQINYGLKGVRKDKVNKLVLAYEPIWAIGTGEVASIKDIVEVLDFVKNLVSDKPYFSEKTIKFIYGGSVSPNNSSEILNTNIVDGALVGWAPRYEDTFVNISKNVNLWILCS